MPRSLEKLFLCLFAFSLSLVAQQTTWIEQTKSNGSGCAAADSRCYAAFNAMQDNQSFGFNPNGVQSRALTYTYNPTPTNVSGPLSGNTQALSIRSLIPYETSANNFRNTPTKVFAHFMPWFYANPFDKAITGYVSNTDAMVQSQLADMKARDFDGLIVSWSGGQQLCRSTTDPQFNPSWDYTLNFPSDSCDQNGQHYKEQSATTTRVANNVSTYGLQFAVMEVDQAFDTDNTCGSSSGLRHTVNEPTCVGQRIEADIRYADANYFTNQNYYRGPSGSAPVVFIFIAEEKWFTQCDFETCNLPNGGTCNGWSTCWTDVWSYISGLSVSRPPALVFKDYGTFSFDGAPAHQIGEGARHLDSTGMYAWVKPRPETGTEIADSSQLDWADFSPWQHAGNSGQDKYILNWFTEAQCVWNGGCTPSIQGKMAVAGVYKGFDQYLKFCGTTCFPAGSTASVNNGQVPVMSQQCGATWLDTWSAIAQSFSATHPADMIQVETWNDYDEGTAIEMGIENCVHVAATVHMDAYSTANSISWSVDQGDQSTIDHFDLYLGSDDYRNTLTLVNSFPVDPNHPASYSVDLAPYNIAAGNYELWVKAVARPGLTNKISVGGFYCGNVSLVMCPRAQRPSRDYLDIPAAQMAYQQAAPPAVQATGSVQILGQEQSGTFCDDSGTRCHTIHDSGRITIAVNGFNYSTVYSSTSTTTSLASALAAVINGNSSGPVTATSSSSTVYLTSKLAGTVGNYPLSVSSITDDPNYFDVSFWGSPSGAYLTGGSN